jgi:hypothetical protein
VTKAKRSSAKAQKKTGGPRRGCGQGSARRRKKAREAEARAEVDENEPAAEGISPPAGEVAEGEAAEVDAPAPKKRRGISVSSSIGKPCEGDSDEAIVVRIKPMRRCSSPTSRFLCGRYSSAQ